MAVRMEAGTAPKGNWVARNLRLVNDNSKELFPKTPAEGKEGRFHTMYKKDYHDFPAGVLLEGLAAKGQQPERETIRDVLFGQSPTSMFANWRIPKRISGECEDARIGDHIGLVPPEKVETPRLLRQSTLPAISLREGPRVFTPKPRVSAAEARHSELLLLRRAKTMDLPPSRSQGARGLLQERANQWQERLPDVDRRLLEKVLRLQDQEKTGSRQSLNGSLLPDARRTVERWMESASEPERQVALQFFSSLAGGRLMGGKGGDQGTRLKEVVDTLQGTGGGRWLAEGGLSPRGTALEREEGEDRKGLKHVRLLDDGTRRQRWMHTTWHHLPNYRLVNPVTNSSSHYIRPHKPQHRHFVIHPDWPPE